MYVDELKRSCTDDIEKCYKIDFRLVAHVAYESANVRARRKRALLLFSVFEPGGLDKKFAKIAGPFDNYFGLAGRKDIVGLARKDRVIFRSARHN